MVFCSSVVVLVMVMVVGMLDVVSKDLLGNVVDVIHRSIGKM